MAAVEVLDLSQVAVKHETPGPDEIVEGTPTTGATPLATLGEVEVGVWEMSVGAVRDTEADEVFLLLEGEATITVEGEPSPIAIKAGDLVRLTAGTKTVWHVTKPLRKIYVAA